MSLIEKTIVDYPLPVSIETTKIILKQLKNSVCKICMKTGGKGTGFFCKIPFFDMNKLLTVLITNNHVIDESYLNKNGKITLSLNNDSLIKVIEIGDRITYTDKKFDITFIQIYQEEDNINEYLELKDNFNQEGSAELYSGNSVYLLHYPKGEKAAISYGILKDIDAYDNYLFSHYCCTEKGSSGSPILSLSDNKILGLHRGSSKFNFNEGTFLKNPIKDFISKNQNKGKFITFNNFHPPKLKFSNLNSKKLFLKKSIDEKKEIIRVKIRDNDKNVDKKKEYFKK